MQLHSFLQLHLILQLHLFLQLHLVLQLHLLLQLHLVLHLQFCSFIHFCSLIYYCCFINHCSIIHHYRGFKPSKCGKFLNPSGGYTFFNAQKISTLAKVNETAMVHLQSLYRVSYSIAVSSNITGDINL